ncbi:hypothetical protein [Stenotrophomonas lactitubi]|uniref:hypothetical protein n=1 Tax=Stenotrophomonas lactitubi TaxID=2045214 RepID=UPI0033428851
MATPEANPKPAKFVFGEPRVGLSTAVLQHFWGDLLDNLCRVEHDGAEIEIDTATAKGFILGLSIGALITDEQRDLMYELLSKAREEAVRRTHRNA